MKHLIPTSRLWIWTAVGLVISLGLAALFYFLRVGKTPEPGTLLPKVPDWLLEKKDQAEEDALVTRAQVKARTDEKKSQLEEISNISEGKERRKRLAEFVRNA